MDGIDSDQYGNLTFTGKGIDVFRLLSLRGMLSLESKGLKTRGGALRPKLATELGLKPRDSYEKYAEAIEAKVEEIRQADESTKVLETSTTRTREPGDA